MDRARFSRISHAGTRFWNPLNEEALVGVLRELPLAEGASVLDYGCGDGAALVELTRGRRLRITGVDPDPEAIRRCRAALDGTFLEARFEAGMFAPASFDLVVNMGASPGFAELVGQVAPLVRPGGRVLLGDGHWEREPAPEYLAFLGMEASDMASLRGNVETLESAGFVVERSLVSTLDDWDRYEDRYDANMLAHLREHPDDPERDAFERRRSRWRDAYLRHGRGTMGFALHVGRKRAG